MLQLSTVLMRYFGYPYNDLVICRDSPDYLGTWHPLPLQVPALTTHIGRGWGLLPGYSHNIALSIVKPHSPCRSPGLKQI